MNPDARAFTVLRPFNPAKRLRKVLSAGGVLQSYDKVYAFRHEQVAFADIRELATILAGLARENAAIIRGAPAADRQPLRKQLAYRMAKGVDRGDEGFVEFPRAWIGFDLDGVRLPPATDWREDPAAAVDAAVSRLPEPFCDASYFWSLTSSHGLEFETGPDGKSKVWTGRFTEGVLHARVYFVLDRAIQDSEAVGWLELIKRDFVSEVDEKVGQTTQTIYIARPLWKNHGDADPLGNMQTCGLVEREYDVVPVPDELPAKLKWARAEGIGASFVPATPSAEAAVQRIGTPADAGDGRGMVRDWMRAAIRHLVRAAPRPEGVEIHAHAGSIVATLQNLTDANRSTIAANLTAHRRAWADVNAYLPDNMTDLAAYEIDRFEARSTERAGDGGGRRKRIRRVDTHKPAEGVSVVSRETAQRIARETVAGFRARVRPFLDQLDAWTEAGKEDPETAALTPPPTAPVVSLGVGTGAGKSTAMREGAAELLADLRRHGDKRSVAFAVPRHDLADEQAEAFRALPLVKRHGLTVAVWRGRGAADPEAPSETMCRRYDEAKAVERAGLDVDTTLCRRKIGEEEIRCPLYEACAYQTQRKARADLWFCAHQLPFIQKPAAFGDLAALFVDESPWQAAVEGVDGPPFDLLVSAIGQDCEIPGDEISTGELRELRGLLHQVLAGESGPVRPAKLKAVFQGQTSASTARKLEWRRKVDPDIRPDMSPAEVGRALQAAAGNATIARLVRLWTLVEELLHPFHGIEASGRLEVIEAEGRKVVRMRGLRSPRDGWAVPTLLADATIDVELLRPIWPAVEPCQRYAVAMPHVSISQVVDRAFSKVTLCPDETTDEAERTRRGNNALKVYAKLLHDARRYDGEVLAIVPLGVEGHLRERAFLPGWLHLAHHGGVAGIDAWKGVQAVYVVGRPLAPSDGVSRTAAALTGRAVTARDYEATTSTIPTKDGGGIEVEAWRHPDEMAERVRWQITEASLLQALGRGRGVLRSAADPLDVHLWTDVPLPELGPVEALVWDQLPVTLDDEMLAAGGVALQNAADAVRAYPDLFRSTEAVKKARQRESGEGSRWGHYPKDKYSIGPCPHLAAVTYRRDVPRAGPAVAYVSRSLLPTLRTWLESRLGPLAMLEPLRDQPPPGSRTNARGECDGPPASGSARPNAVSGNTD